MTWSDFYLLCFLVGFALSLVSLLAGSVHLHLPHFHLDGLHMPHGDAPHAGGGELSPVNFGTIAAFLAWFGGTGFLLRHYYHVWFLLVLGIASLAGLGGAAIVFWFLAKFLVRPDENLDPADYDMIGVLGKVGSTIRPGGTGEIVFSQEGSRRSAPARSEGGNAIARDVEVVVTRYEKGIAYVRRWEELTGTAASEGAQDLHSKENS